MRLQNLTKIVVSGLSAAVSFLVLAVGLSFLLPVGPVSDDLGFQIQLLMVTGKRFYLVLIGIFIFMTAWSYIYFLIQRSLPGLTWGKGLLFGGLMMFVGFWLQHRFYLSLLYRDWPSGLIGSDLFILLLASLAAGVTLSFVQEKV